MKTIEGDTQIDGSLSLPGESREIVAKTHP